MFRVSVKSCDVESLKTSTGVYVRGLMTRGGAYVQSVFKSCDVASLRTNT